MKKLGIIALAALLVVAFTMPAAALENVFGGYWRTRFVSQSDFNGTADEAKDLSRVDTRTRLYWTAILNDNVKLVNKFEMDAVFGEPEYGDVGADGISVEVKNTYADFNTGPVNWKMGVQGYKLARGFLYDTDASGAILTYGADSFTLPFGWFRVEEGGTGPMHSDGDIDNYVFAPVISLGETVSLNPYLLYYMSADWDLDAATDDPLDVFFLGFDVDVSFDMGGFWGTFIYESGTLPDTYFGTAEDVDVSAYLIGFGGNVKLGPADIHGQVLYSPGDDGTNEDYEQFLPPAGVSYYWAEIMGLGTFDQQAAGPWGDNIQNIVAFNIGVSFKPMEKMTLGIDLWDASYEDNGTMEEHVGTEIDFSLKYKLIEGLNLDVVAAYLSADDGLYDGADQEDPVELGARFSLSF